MDEFATTDASPAPARVGFTTSVRLLDGLRSRDKAAWDRFAALYEPLLERWLQQAGAPSADRPDLRQEVMLAVAQRVTEFEHVAGRATFRGWLRAIALNKAVDLRRKRLPASNDATIDHIPAPEFDEAASVSAERKVLFRRALDLIRTDFEPTTWAAFWGVVVEDRTPAAMAAELGITPNAVYLAKARILRRLREEFADFLECESPDK